MKHVDYLITWIIFYNRRWNKENNNRPKPHEISNLQFWSASINSHSKLCTDESIFLHWNIPFKIKKFLFSGKYVSVFFEVNLFFEQLFADWNFASQNIVFREFCRRRNSSKILNTRNFFLTVWQSSANINYHGCLTLISVMTKNETKLETEIGKNSNVYHLNFYSRI